VAMARAEQKDKTATIVVNTRPHSWSEKDITFEQVVGLAVGGEQYDPTATTVEYSRGHGPDRSLRAGESVRVKDGMIFDVQPSLRS
jgi:hypothetical protein